MLTLAQPRPTFHRSRSCRIWASHQVWLHHNIICWHLSYCLLSLLNNPAITLASPLNSRPSPLLPHLSKASALQKKMLFSIMANCSMRLPLFAKKPAGPYISCLFVTNTRYLPRKIQIQHFSIENHTDFFGPTLIKTERYYTHSLNPIQALPANYRIFVPIRAAKGTFATPISSAKFGVVITFCSPDKQQPWRLSFRASIGFLKLKDLTTPNKACFATDSSRIRRLIKVFKPVLHSRQSPYL